MGAKVHLAKHMKTTTTRARLVAPIKRAFGYRLGAEGPATTGGGPRWKLYAALCVLPVLALVALAAFVSGGYPASAAPQAAAGTPTAAVPTATEAKPAGASASPAVTTTQAPGTPAVRATPSGPPPPPENMLTFFGSPS